jgi:hypothetical protein
MKSLATEERKIEPVTRTVEDAAIETGSVTHSAKRRTANTIIINLLEQQKINESYQRYINADSGIFFIQPIFPPIFNPFN